MYRLDTILVDSPKNGIGITNGDWTANTQPYTAIVEIEDDSSEFYIDIDSNIPFSSNSLAKNIHKSNTLSTPINKSLSLKEKCKNARSTFRPSNTPTTIIEIDSPTSHHNTEDKLSIVENDQHITNNKLSLQNNLKPQIIKKLQSLHILCGKYLKVEESRRPEVATEFLVSLIEYSGFPRIESNNAVFRKLKSQLVIRPEIRDYQLYDVDLYIRIGASISTTLRNFLKKNPGLSITPESPLPKITILPNNLLDITICLLCVGFRQIRRYSSILLDRILRFTLRNNKYANIANQLLHVLVNIRSQDVMSDSRISAYQLLAKHINRIQFNLTEILSRGLKDSSIQVRRLVMSIMVDLIKMEQRHGTDLSTLLDITFQRFIETPNARDRSDVAKFWLSAVEHGAAEFYNFQQMVLLAKNSRNCINAFNLFLREYLKKSACIRTTGDSLALVNNLEATSNSPSRVFNIEGLQMLIQYIFSLMEDDKSLDEEIGLGIFTSNLISATWEAFPFLLDLPVIVDFFEQFDNISNPHGVGRDKFYIIMFSLLKQALKCLVSSNDHFISLKNDAIVSLLTSFKSLSNRAESQVCYTLLLESLSRVSEFIDSINYSIGDYLEDISRVIYARLSDIKYNSSICIHSLRCLQKFATSTCCSVEDDLIKFVEIQRQNDYKKSSFVIAHISHTLNWKYVKDILYDLCKINDFDVSSSYLVLLYAIFETGVYTKVKSGLDADDVQHLALVRNRIYQVAFQLLNIDNLVVVQDDPIDVDEVDVEGHSRQSCSREKNSGQEDSVSKFSVVLASVILLTLQLENLIVDNNDIKQHALSDSEESILSKIFYRVFNRDTPVLSVQKSIFASLVTHQLPLDNIERMEYWDNEYVDAGESCSSLLARQFSMTLNTSLYSSSIGALLFCQLCSKNKTLASSAKEFCMLLMKTNKTLLYDILLCVITYKSDGNNEKDNNDEKIKEKQLLFINLCSVFVDTTELLSTPKDIKRFILNAVNYVVVETPKNSQFILNVIKLFMKPAFIASNEWNDLKHSLKKSLANTPHHDIIRLLLQ